MDNSPVQYIPPVPARNNGNNIAPDFADQVKAVYTRRRGTQQSITPEQIATVIELIEDGEFVSVACKKAGISEASYYRLRENRPELQELIAPAHKIGLGISARKALQAITEFKPETMGDHKAAQVQSSHLARVYTCTIDHHKRVDPAQFGDKVQNSNINVNVDVAPCDLSSYSNR